MPLFRTLLFEVAKRAAMNPRTLAEALRFYRDHLHPHAVQAARQSQSAAEQLRSEWQATAAEVDPRRDPGRFAGRLVGRLRKRSFP